MKSGGMKTLIVNLLCALIFEIHALEFNSSLIESKSLRNAEFSSEDQMLYVVSIQRKNEVTKNFVPFGAASMVTPYFGVTIAECVIGIEVKMWDNIISKVKYIVWSRNDAENPQGRIHYIDKVHCPKAQDMATDKDYAILKLKNRVKTIGFEPVKVESRYYQVPIQTVRWMSPNSGLMKLQPYELQTVLPEDCMESNGIYVANNQVCTYEKSGGFYMADPGSPLIYQGKLMGVAYATRCDKGYSYGVFLILESYVDEIQVVVGESIR